MAGKQTSDITAEGFLPAKYIHDAFKRAQQPYALVARIQQKYGLLIRQPRLHVVSYG